MHERSPPLRLAELIAALSLATDLGSGQPFGHGMRAGIIASRLAGAAGLSEDERRDAYYLAMLRYIGCTAGAHVVAEVLGDEVTSSTWFATINQGQPLEAFAAIARHTGTGLPPWRRVPAVVQALAGMRGLYTLAAAHCEVATHVAHQLRLPSTLREALPFLTERWNGKGLPGKTGGDGIPVAVRVMNLAQDAAVFLRVGGPDAAIETLRRRSGHAHDPKLVELLCKNSPEMLAGLEESPSWELAIDAEPEPRETVSAVQLRSACEAVADFVDLKSPYLSGHSRGVAALTSSAAVLLRLSDEECRELEIAALVHDVGRVAVSSAIWQRLGPLSDDDWERGRLHAYQTERVLARPRALERLGELASFHHERIDGSGYHRRARGEHLSRSARVLAVADVVHAMCEPRPHRRARTEAQAADEVRHMARLGQLDAERSMPSWRPPASRPPPGGGPGRPT